MRRAGRSFAKSILLAALASGCAATAPQDEMVPLEKAPANLLEAAKENLPDVTIHQSLKRSDGRFEFRGKDPSGKIRTINLSSTGEVLEIE